MSQCLLLGHNTVKKGLKYWNRYQPILNVIKIGNIGAYHIGLYRNIGSIRLMLHGILCIGHLKIKYDICKYTLVLTDT